MDSMVTVTANRTNTSNDTSLDESASLSLLAVVGLGSVVCVVTVLANLSLLIAFVVQHTIRKPKNYLLVSLALADLLIGCIMMPIFLQYVYLDEWRLGQEFCDTWKIIDYSVCTSARTSVFLITTDRYLSLRFPWTYREYQTKRNVGAFIAMAWVMPLAVFTTATFGWTLDDCYVVSDKVCRVPFTDDAIFGYMWAIGYYWLQLVYMCVLYRQIYAIALGVRKPQVSNTQTKSASSSRDSSASWNSLMDSACKANMMKPVARSGSYSGSGKKDHHQSAPEGRLVNGGVENQKESPRLDSVRREEDVSKPDASGQGSNPDAKESEIMLQLTSNQPSTRANQFSETQYESLVATNRSTATSQIENQQPETKNQQMVTHTTMNKQTQTENQDTETHMTNDQQTETANENTETHMTLNQQALTTNQNTDTHKTKGEQTETKNEDTVTHITMNQEALTTKQHTETHTTMNQETENQDTETHMTMNQQALTTNQRTETHKTKDQQTQTENQDTETHMTTNQHTLTKNQDPETETQQTVKYAAIKAKSTAWSLDTKGGEQSDPSNVERPSSRLLAMAVNVKLPKRLRRFSRFPLFDNQGQKTLRAITLILGAFFVCWTPFYVTMTMVGYHNVSRTVYNVTCWLCYFSSTINPLCYALANPEFKRTFMRIIKLDWRAV